MIIVRRLLSFLVLLLVTLYIGYFSYLNTDKIFVFIPGLGELPIPAALGFLASFAMGALFTCLFFGYEFLKKVFELRAVKKELKQTSGGYTSTMPKTKTTEPEPPPISNHGTKSKGLDFFSSMDDEPGLDEIDSKS